jgi:hypothetical protein
MDPLGPLLISLFFFFFELYHFYYEPITTCYLNHFDFYFCIFVKQGVTALIVLGDILNKLRSIGLD